MNKLKRNKPINPRNLRFFLNDNIPVCSEFGNRPDSLNNVKIVLPQSLVAYALQLTHDNLCHQGIDKTLRRLKEMFYWPKMSAQVKNWIQSCHSCMQRRGHKPRKFAPLQTQDIPDAPFSKIAIDIVVPLPVTERGNRYIIKPN